MPEGLAHDAGRELEFEIGTLRPNETRQLQLTLKADKPGLVRNEVLVRGEGNLIAQHTVELEVIAPALEVALNGPKLRYLERPATYEVVISNPGTAPAREVEVVTYLPKGMKFVDGRSQRPIRAAEPRRVLEPGGIARQSDRGCQADRLAPGDRRTETEARRPCGTRPEAVVRTGRPSRKRGRTAIRRARRGRPDRDRRRNHLPDHADQQRLERRHQRAAGHRPAGSS